MSATHTLKTLSRFYRAVERGDKTFEVRRNDRDFQTGDTLVLVEIGEPGFEPGKATGFQIERRVSYMLQGGQFGVDPAYCILGLAQPTLARSLSEDKAQ